MRFGFHLTRPTSAQMSDERLDGRGPLEDDFDYVYLAMRGCADLGGTDASFLTRRPRSVTVRSFWGCAWTWRPTSRYRCVTSARMSRNQHRSAPGRMGRATGRVGSAVCD